MSANPSYNQWLSFLSVNSRLIGVSCCATPGTCAHVPAGVVRHFKNEGDKPVRMIFVYAPGGFEQQFPPKPINNTHGDDVRQRMPETIERLQALRC